MRSLLLSIVLGVASLGLIGLNPGDSRGAIWLYGGGMYPWYGTPYYGYNAWPYTNFWGASSYYNPWYVGYNYGNPYGYYYPWSVGALL